MKGTMEFFNYDGMDEEYDRILEEAEPCEQCGSKDHLVLVAVTSEELFGHVLMLCAACHIEKEETSFPDQKEEDRVTA